MRRMREDRRRMGASPHLSTMRHDALLRLVTKSPRQQTRARGRTSGHRFRATGRTLVILLSRRGLLRVLGIHHRVAAQHYSRNDCSLHSRYPWRPQRRLDILFKFDAGFLSRRNVCAGASVISGRDQRRYRSKPNAGSLCFLLFDND